MRINCTVARQYESERETEWLISCITCPAIEEIGRACVLAGLFFLLIKSEYRRRVRLFTRQISLGLVQISDLSLIFFFLHGLL